MLKEDAGATSADSGFQPLTPDLSFLAQPGATAFNLKPDANGNVHIATAALGHGQFLRVIALSGDSAAVRDFTLPDKPLQIRDLRLAKGLDPAGHFTQQNAVTVLEKDVPFSLKDALSSRFQTYGNLNSAYYCAHAVIEGMKASGGGSIVAIGSVDPQVQVRSRTFEKRIATGSAK